MTHVRTVGSLDGVACTECYFYGFVDRSPVDDHFCLGCRRDCLRNVAGRIVETAELSFEEWQEATPRMAFKNISFEEMMRQISMNADQRLAEHKEAIEQAEVYAQQFYDYGDGVLEDDAEPNGLLDEDDVAEDWMHEEDLGLEPNVEAEVEPNVEPAQIDNPTPEEDATPEEEN